MNVLKLWVTLGDFGLDLLLFEGGAHQLQRKTTGEVTGKWTKSSFPFNVNKMAARTEKFADKRARLQHSQSKLEECRGADVVGSNLRTSLLRLGLRDGFFALCCKRVGFSGIAKARLLPEKYGARIRTKKGTNCGYFLQAHGMNHEKCTHLAWQSFSSLTCSRDSR